LGRARREDYGEPVVSDSGGNGVILWRGVLGGGSPLMDSTALQNLQGLREQLAGGVVGRLSLFAESGREGGF